MILVDTTCLVYAVGDDHKRQASAKALIDFSDLLGPLEPTTAPDAVTALTLWQDNPQIGTFDALLLAVAVRTGAEAIVSEDAGLARIGVMPVMTAAQAVRAFGSKDRTYFGAHIREAPGADRSGPPEAAYSTRKVHVGWLLDPMSVKDPV